MRVAIASDLHVEFHRDGGETLSKLLPEADALVLAGDIGTPNTLLRMLGYLYARYPHLFYVTGNHEYYGGSVTEVHQELEAWAASRPNFHWLRDSAVEVMGQRFIGSTLWFSRFPGWEQRQYNMNDFHLIQGFVPWVFDTNAATQAYLAAEVKPTDIVVTHYLPSPQSVHPMYANSPLNGFFVCDVEATIWAKQPKLWIHGHTHTSMDYKIGDTRVLCNPFGYLRREENPQFKQALVIDI